MKLTHERLKEVLHYDPLTGIFRWLVHKRKSKQGAIAGSDHDGYVRIIIDYEKHYAHRLAVFYMTGKWPDFVDHRNRNTSENKWENLRECNRVQNNGNRRLCSDKNHSGYKGVCWSKKKKRWVAQISVQNRPRFLGHFDDPAEAHQAYMRAAASYFGEFARAS